MQLSVIIPTYNEEENVVELLSRLNESLREVEAEVIFVDDGDDHLPETALTTPSALPVRVIRRTEPIGRLGGAVVHGMKHARGDLLVCMDGDQQHPPELIPQMIEAAHNSDMVVASRYIEGGDAGGLSNGFRKFVSKGTGFLTKLAFPKRLKNCSDPMSGFFLVRSSRLDLDSLQPKGFKILLEIVARSKAMKLVEVPMQFGERTAGESHASMSEGMRFLRQLAFLRLYNKAFLFMLVGASGVIPNLIVLLALTNSGMHYLPATFFAIQVAGIWNFLGAEFLVWQDHDGSHWFKRFWKFVLVFETDLVRIPFMVPFVYILGGHYVIASLITMVLAFFLRFTLADRLVYGKKTLVVETHLPVIEAEVI